MVASVGKDWRELCAEAATEPDSEKVASLVNQILQTFDELDKVRPELVSGLSSEE
jgi:hypothetical protein